MAPRTEDEIRKRAHELWESEGRPHGRHDEHWQRAQQEDDAGAAAAPADRAVTSIPGMLGDGTEEQNLNQPGDPKARISKDEVDAAFGSEPAPRKSK